MKNRFFVFKEVSFTISFICALPLFLVSTSSLVKVSWRHSASSSFTSEPWVSPDYSLGPSWRVADNVFFCQTCLWWDSQCIRVRAFIEWKGVLFDTEPSRYSGKYCFLEIPACCQFWFYLFISAWCLGSLLSFCIYSFYFGSYLFVYLYPYEYMCTCGQVCAYAWTQRPE